VRAGGPTVVAGEALGVGRLEDVRQDRRVEPLLPHVLRVDRQPRREREAPCLCLSGQALELRPRRLGVHVVDRDRRDAAPVVDACFQ
jgi:hypothetical protein